MLNHFYSIYNKYRVSQKSTVYQIKSVLRMVQLQCNILRHDEYDFYLDLCKVSIPYVKGNYSYKCELEEYVAGQAGLGG